MAQWADSLLTLSFILASWLREEADKQAMPSFKREHIWKMTGSNSQEEKKRVMLEFLEPQR